MYSTIILIIILLLIVAGFFILNKLYRNRPAEADDHHTHDTDDGVCCGKHSNCSKGYDNSNLYFDDEELGEEPLDVYHDVLRGWLEDADYALPVNRVHTMTFEEGYSYFGDCDRYFEERLDQLRCDFSEEAIDAYLQKHRGNYGSRIGGYCDFAQYDPRRSDSLLHILQLDSEEGINFCDCGVLHLFINKESAEAKDWGL